MVSGASPTPSRNFGEHCSKRPGHLRLVKAQKFFLKLARVSQGGPSLPPTKLVFQFSKCRISTDKPSQGWIDSTPIRFIQIPPDLFRSIHSNPNSLSLTQIHPISIRFALTHTDSCTLTQICSGLSSFTQFRSDSHNFPQSHSDSLIRAQTCSDPFSRTQIHSDSFSLAPDSLGFPQTHADSLRFIQIYSDLLRQAPPNKS